ncbi:MAG: hypothetical protein Q7U08_05470 [Flavobacteriaceae bacterium]|nr:hypothetical protein [Flavobacteriaceae bacterium]
MEFKFNKYLSKIFWITLIVYSIIAFFYFNLKPAGGGDESLFISDLDLIKNQGWIVAIKKNISIPYMLLAYPLSLFMKNYLALRLVNLFLLSALFFYFINSKKYNLNFYGYLLFFISTVGYFYFGTNDTLFFICLVVFINEVNNLINYQKWNGTLALCMLVIVFFTRELVIVYLPLIFIAFYLIHQKKGWSTVKVIYPLSLLIIFVILNIPSLIEKGEFSHDLKSPPSNIEATWAQRQYLAQLLVNKGELKNYQHPSWEQTQAYLDVNGKNSLPIGMLEGMYFDVSLTIKEFFKDLIYSFFYGFRQLGLILFFTLFFLFKVRLINKRLNLNIFIPFSLLMMMSIFSLIIISYVELRWLAPVFIATIIFYSNLEKDQKITKNIRHLNLFILILLSNYGILKLLFKFI